MAHGYTANGSRVALTVDPEYLAVRYHRDSTRGVRSAVTEQAPLGPFEHRVEVPGERLTIHPVRPTTEHKAARADVTQREAANADAVEQVAAHPDVRRVARVYRRGNQRLVAAERVIVGFRPGTSDVARLVEEHGATIVDQDGDEYLISVPGSEDPLEVCAKLDAMESVEFAEPDFVMLGHESPRRPEGAEKEARSKPAGSTLR